MALKDRIEECLKETGTKYVDLAKATKSPRATVSDWTSGKTKSMSVEKLLLAAQFFNIQPIWLGTGKGPKYYPDTPYFEKENNHDIKELAPGLAPGLVNKRTELIDLINKTASSGELSDECMDILSALIKKMLTAEKNRTHEMKKYL